ncbi:MAG: hypothetical protein JWM77_3429 [Rhodospirillales bacterium]|jgi:hypothetical protein|nr:hypothetical protein [Rhodospirillales bacterium]
MSLGGFGTYGGLGGGMGGFSSVTPVNAALPSRSAAQPASRGEPARPERVDVRVIEDESKKA